MMNGSNEANRVEVTGQVRFDGHTLQVVAEAAALVNTMVPGESRGRDYPPAADDAQLRARADSVIHRSYGVRTTGEQAEGLAGLAARLRLVFDLVEAGDFDAAAELVNTMAREYDARPTLIRHDGEPWHLHFHAPDTPMVPGIGAGQAAGLAFVLGSEHADRIGVCSADSCDRVYVDVSRNGTKRFCSTACQNRVKTAAFRARRAVGTEAGTGAETGAEQAG
jgi:predicted RNA-binding Zn ribbon-like protein